MRKALSFDDVLLVPKRTFGGSRKQVDLSTTICGYTMQIPIFSANMSSVTEVDMAIAMHKHGGLGILHRMCTADEQLEMVKKLWINDDMVPVFVSIEGSEEGIKRIEAFRNYFAYGYYPYGYCIDVAHADSLVVEETVITIVNKFPGINLIVGNYATSQGIHNLVSKLLKDTKYLSDSSIKLVFKIGVGSGCLCTTRIVTGCGLPTLESIFEIRKEFPCCTGLKIIADGGIKNSGDIVKCLAAGADSVMLGHLLAGTKETPGNVIKYKDGLYKVYRGSASFGQKFDVGKDGYVEGEETLVNYKSQVTTTLTQLIEGMKSGFSYCGAMNLQELQDNAEFVEISNASFKESMAHGS